MNPLKNLKVGGRLVAGFALMTCIVLVNGAASLFSTFSLNNSLTDIASVRMPGLSALLEADRDLHGAVADERAMIFANTESELFPSLVKGYDDHIAHAQSQWKLYKELADTDAERALIPQYESSYAAWQLLSRKIVDARVSDTRDGRREALDLSLGQASAAFAAMESRIDELRTVTVAEAAGARRHADAVFRFNSSCRSP